MSGAEDGILAVVVSYNGGDQLASSVAALRGQVSRVLVVDNGSDAASRPVLDALERSGDADVIRFGVNRGTGCALNAGVRRARELDCGWVLTMDQDSVVAPTMLAAYRDAIEADSTIVCLTPGSLVGAAAAGRPERVAYAITSGNLVRADLFDRVGPYDESLFVDCVDFDFSLRVRGAGYGIHRVPTAAMRHQLGEKLETGAQQRRFYAMHSPVRRYYMFRNYMYLMERYLLRFPLFILKLGVLHVVLFLLIGVYDPRPRDSYGAVFRGLCDWIARRQGPYAGPAR